MSDAVESAISQINDKLKKIIDKKLIEDLNGIVSRLQEKKDKGEKPNLNDLRDVLRIYRNIVLPAAIKQEAEKLRVAKDIALANGTVGVSKSI